MNNICKVIGARLRDYRQKQHLTQEELAELSGLHYTYIGQVERGEKNITIESLNKILTALNVSFSELFEGLDPHRSPRSTIALQCYEIIRSKPEDEQQLINDILSSIEKISKHKSC